MSRSETDHGMGVDETGVLLTSVAARLTRLYGKVLSQLEVPLTFRQQRLLMRVREGHTSLAALAKFGNLTVPTVSESIDLLVRRKLMTRTEHPESRRSLLLTLTPLGEQACAAAQEALAKANAFLLSDIPEDRKDILHESFKTVFDAATTYFLTDQ